MGFRGVEFFGDEVFKLLAEKPAVVVFYRGAWCMYCNQHLVELQSAEAKLSELGYQVIAVSPDRPEVIKQYAADKGLAYRLMSDSDMTAALSLGIAFKVDDGTVAKYKGEYGIDIEGNSGQAHHLLPVPAALIVGTDGLIQFAQPVISLILAAAVLGEPVTWPLVLAAAVIIGGVALARSGARPTKI